MSAIAVVTGASSGIGRAVALRLARDGFALACVDRSPEARGGGFDAQPGVPTVEAIRRAGGHAAHATLDVADESAWDTALDAALASLGGSLRAGVLCAGIFERDVSILEETAGEHDRTLAVNLRGAWLGLRALGRRMVAGGEGGRLVCMGSMSGLVGLRDEPSYCASKAGVHGLVRACALDLAPYAITVNAVAPGFVATAMLQAELADAATAAQLAATAPLGRVAQVDDVAGAVSFLVGPDATFVTGVTLPVDGGATAQ